MKTITELSGSLIRMAVKALAEATKSLPEPEMASAPAQAAQAPPSGAAEAAPAPASPGAEVSEPAEGAPAEGAGGGQAAASQAAGEGAESEAVKAALDAAVAGATGLSGKRLELLRSAVKATGRRTADVRLVRVFGPEEKVEGATTIGDYQYLVDFSPTDMKQTVTSPKKERGGRGGGGRSGGRSAGGGGKASATGGFSMDSLRDDRKGQRGGGRPGGKGPGGGPRR